MTKKKYRSFYLHRRARVTDGVFREVRVRPERATLASVLHTCPGGRCQVVQMRISLRFAQETLSFAQGDIYWFLF